MMATSNGLGQLLTRNEVLKVLQVSSSTLDRMVAKDRLTVVKRVRQTGQSKPRPLFDRHAVEALAEQRHAGVYESPMVDVTPLPLGEGEGHLHRQIMVKTPAPPSLSTAGLLTGVRALHETQQTLIQALQQPSGYAIESELWHALLCVSRTVPRLLEEVLLDSPLPQEQGVAHHEVEEKR